MFSPLNRKRKLRGETGSAFVISILVLFVLTVLGVALMLTTTTETDIAANYRWGEMAFYNADAGLEVAKNILAGYALRDGTFINVLPQPRVAGQMLAPPAVPAGFAGASRDNQYYLDQGVCAGGANCRMYIGVVLQDQFGRVLQYDFRAPAAGDTRGDLDGDNAPDVEGTVTVWVRRPIVGQSDYGAADNPTTNGRHDRVILTAEGTAPSYDAAETGRGALKRIEMTVSIPVQRASNERYSDATKGSDTRGTAVGADSGNIAATVQ